MGKLQTKNKQKTNNNSTIAASGGSILKNAGRWVGNDFAEYLDLVYASRGKAKF